MSLLVTLIEVPKSSIEWQSWSFAHMADHFDIVRVIFQLTGRRLDLFPLDPIDFRGSAWVYNHAVMHQQMDRVLGIAGYDLSGVDWRDPQSVLSFTNYNYNEHQAAEQILRL